ncbi:MAG: phage holin family protein [Erythrobacter sp.]|jgi:hypothetical protein|nr:phage holin family protein [Erythrobacter sp.]
MLQPETQDEADTAGPQRAAAINHTSAAGGEDRAPPGEPPIEEPPPIEESMVEKVAALIDNARTYAEAEFGFQRTRVALTGRNLASALAFVVLALVLLHIAIIALAVGFVIALAPFVTIWGAIAIVVGVLLCGTGLFLWRAVVKVRRVAAMFDNANAKPGPRETSAA